MAAPLTDVAGLLRRLQELLVTGGEPRWAQSLGGLAAAAEGATDDADRRAVVTQVLGLYGGMGSFSDVVLQDRDGVLPEQQELQQLRTRLFEAAREALS